MPRRTLKKTTLAYIDLRIGHLIVPKRGLRSKL